MTIKTTGAEFKRFYNDDATWPEDTWHEDEILEVNGADWDFHRKIDDIPDDAIIKLTGGVVLGHPGGIEPTLEAYFKSWRKKQTVRTLLVECDASKFDAIKAAIKAAGGLVA